MDSMAQGIMVLGSDLRVRTINDRARALMGVPPEIARVGAHMADLFRHNAKLGEYGEGEVEDLVNEQIVRLVTAWEDSIVHLRADGTRVKVRRTTMPDGGWVTTYTDVTAEAEAEAKLARLAEVPARNPNPVIELDAEGNPIIVNDAASSLFKKIEERGLEHPALAGVAAMLERRKPGRKKAVTEEVAVGRRAFHRRVVPGQYRDGVLVYFNEITDLRRAQQRTRESEERHRQLLEQMPDAVLVHDGGAVLYANPAAAELFAASSVDELVGCRVIDLSPEDLRATVRANIDRALERGAQVGPLETRKLRLDGQEVQVQLTGQGFVDRGGRSCIQVVLRDVTEQRLAEAQARRLEEQLRQAQKMEALGTLAGGIAHDFNNLLGAIIGYADLTAEDVADGSTAAQNLEQIMAAGGRARDLVQQILSFSRREQGEVGPVRLDGVVDEVVRLLRPTVPATIGIVPCIEVANAVIEGKSGQIHQVLMNLATNAVQSIGRAPGRITIALEGRHVEAGMDTATGPLAEGDYYVLEVADTGTGMERETVARMFEPFFTTKDVGEGTGMGLAVVHGIIGDHGGAIDVESAPGQGTLVRVYLPCGQAACGPDDARRDRRPDNRRQGRILVVDDEAMIADMAGKVLERQGYEVECVYSALEALATLRARIADFDLLITDQTMPNLTGDALIREAHRLAPSLPVILSSGYGRALSSDDARAIGAHAFLAKPYSPAELCATVHAALDGDGPGGSRSDTPPKPGNQPHSGKEQVP